MQVPLGDHKARLELFKPDFNMQIVKEGFSQGRVHPDDVEGVIYVLRKFYNNRYIKKATDLWGKGDSMVLTLLPVSEVFHKELNAPNPSPQKLDVYLPRIDKLNHDLTILEDEFTATLGEGSRWLENLILKILLCVAITVEFTGLFLTAMVTRNISKELSEIYKATSKVARGDLNARAAVLSKNEIGKVAAEVNEMTEQLIRSNKELEQVAYIASHDLQEPLHTIANFVNLFQKQYKVSLDEASAEYLHYIKDATARMQALVRDMLDYSRIGSDKKLMQLDCNKEVKYVLEDMAAKIEENYAQVTVCPLPVINGYFEIKLLFQNLISNAIKFRNKDLAPCIRISCTDEGEEWLFRVQDNGIGIERKYYDRIFTIFQRLHSQNEYGGTGIGLAHCKKIVDLHRGKIWLTSESQRGSTFYFTIPKYEPLDARQV